MTPQEHDLITALLGRLNAQANQPKDAEADALIRRAMAEQPDAPYLLTQTVLIQDMALSEAQRRIAELERQLAAAKTAPAGQSTSFLGGAARGSVPSAGPWMTSPSPPSPAAAPGVSRPASAAMAGNPSPGMPVGAGSGFLRQAASTAAGIAGGALLFQGIQSLFGPHWGSGFLSGVAAQPSISETVINVGGDDPGAGDLHEADSLSSASDMGTVDDSGMAADADQAADPDADMSDQDFADPDVGGGGDYDV